MYCSWGECPTLFTALMRVRYVVANWTRTHVDMGSNPRQVKSFFYAIAMLFFYSIQRITMPRLCIFGRPIIVYRSMILLLWCYCQFHLTILFVRHAGITDCRKLKGECWVDPNGVSFKPNFIQIRPAVLVLNHADGQTHRHRYDQPYMLSHRAKNAQ
jgi:hypothetical protein